MVTVISILGFIVAVCLIIMKELSIEEKAKAYDEAKLRMSAAYNSNRCTIGFMNEIFPELKESEDDRIKKRIIQALHGDVLDIDEISKCTAWLEKQGTPAKLSEEEQNRFAKGVLTSCAMSFIDYLDAHKYKGKMCVSNGECEDIENAFLNAMWDRLHRYYCKYIEKQGEQKEDATRYKITEYLKKLILDQSQRGAPMFNYEGRIEEEVDFIINIAKKELKLEEQGKQKEHNKFIESIQIGDQVTRNQDGMLVNLSQLKRVAKPSEKQGEKKPAENKGMNLDEEEMTPFQKKVFCIIDTTIEEEQGLKQVCDELFALASNEIKQKPAWSEEDIRRYNSILSSIKYCSEQYQAEINWLKSLRPQKQWKPSEEHIKVLDKVIRNPYISSAEYNGLIALKEQLKQL